MNTIRKTLLAAVASLGLAVSSHAGAVLFIYDGINMLTVTDNVYVNGVDTAADGSTVAGVVKWGGTFGMWDLDITTSGVTTGTASSPNLHLNVAASSTGAGYLHVYYADTNFGPTNGVVNAAIGGYLATGADAYNYTFLSTTNDITPPGAYDVTLTGAYFAAGAFSGTQYAALNAVGPYALYEAVYLTHTVGGSSSLDANLSVPDKASTALLIGLGLLGIGAAARRKKLV